MNKTFLILSFLMGAVVLASNYLVQFPVKYYGLEKILTYDLVIIDDIDQIVYSYDIEEKLFSIINDFILNKKDILVTSSEPLNKIKFKLPDLASRLKWDQVLIIPELTDTDKIKVLQKIAKERGWILSDNVCDYIMTHYKRDLFFLCNEVGSLIVP